MQQKRTVEALASQREQTQRMADSLTTSFISSRNSPESDHKQRPRSETKNRVSDEDDANVLRLVSSTHSPDRASLHGEGDDDENGSHGD